MVKSIFVSAKEIGGIAESGANHLIVASDTVDKENWLDLKRLGMDLAISVNAFDRGGCPADPSAYEKLRQRILQALEYNPSEIWLDHFRFDGHWETIKMNKISDLHGACEFCMGKNRASVMGELARMVMSEFTNKAKIGYFAVPFKVEGMEDLVDGLGMDHRILGKIFDMSSPMLYHRMIKMPVTFISEYVKYMYDITQKEILPIIQIKDMPDNLEDKMSEPEIESAFSEAIKFPSSGASIFWWHHAIEKDKMNIVSKLFSSI